MNILDTNLWMFGTLRTHERAVAELDAIERGETTAAINAYIVQEAIASFQRTESLSPTEPDSTREPGVPPGPVDSGQETSTVPVIPVPS